MLFWASMVKTGLDNDRPISAKSSHTGIVKNSMKKIAKPNFHQKSYVCIHVFDQSRPVLLVSRDGGSWCFLCGHLHPDSAEHYRAVGLGHVIERDASLGSILDLLPNEEAQRAASGERWIRTNMQPD
jgi:hypothetical protein